jgi:drug/metabolite transporter (DMT)-like permease
MDDLTRAKLLLVLSGVCWGINWPLIRIGLTGLTPWDYRLTVFVVGAAILIAVVVLTGRRLTEPRGMTWVHLFASSMLNVAAFGIFSTFAMLTASTSRVAVVSYSFPVWACLLAWLVLGEKLRAGAILGLVLCVGGLAVLVYPVIETSAAIGLGLSLCSAMSWAAGTIYLKLVRIPGDMLVNTALQLAMAAAVMFALTLTFQGWPTFGTAPAVAIVAAVLNGLIGSAAAYLIWYHIIGHLPATTASLGSLMSPAVGVVSAVLILNEWPSAIDVVGFTLIFAAAVSAILQPRVRPPTLPTPDPEVRR